MMAVPADVISDILELRQMLTASSETERPHATDAVSQGRIIGGCAGQGHMMINTKGGKKGVEGKGYF